MLWVGGLRSGATHLLLRRGLAAAVAPGDDDPSPPAPSAIIAALQCPSSTTTMADARVNATSRHYDAYALRRCNDGRDNWLSLSAADHRAIARRIFQFIGAKKSDVVFDWGCGCGTKLRCVFVVVHACVHLEERTKKRQYVFR